MGTVQEKNYTELNHCMRNLSCQGHNIMTLTSAQTQAIQVGILGTSQKIPSNHLIQIKNTCNKE